MRRIFFPVILLLALTPFFAYAADGSLYVSPNVGVYTIGEIFEVKIFADTGGQKINAAEAEMTFSPEALEVQRISTADSILESWPTPPSFSNQKGIVRFSGWTKGNYAGPSGLLVTITFKALRTHTSNAYLAAGAILAADGKGSNIITTMKSGLYTVEPRRTGGETESIVIPQAAEVDVDSPLLSNVQTDSRPEAPVFFPNQGSVDVGSRIMVNGTTSPNSKVLFFLAKGNESEKASAITSDSDGSFTYVSDQGAREGVYRLRAFVEDANGQVSAPAKITITARESGVAAVVAVSTNVASTLVPLLALLVLGGLGAGYLVHLHTLEKMKHGQTSRRARG